VAVPGLYPVTGLLQCLAVVDVCWLPSPPYYFMDRSRPWPVVVGGLVAWAAGGVVGWGGGGWCAGVSAPKRFGVGAVLGLLFGVVGFVCLRQVVGGLLPAALYPPVQCGPNRV